VSTPAGYRETVRVTYSDLLASTSKLFTGYGIPPDRADTAAEALCYGDLCGLGSHGLFNLPRLYLPLLDQGRVDPVAEPIPLIDTNACLVLDARRSLGLWAAADAMDRAVRRAEEHGAGMVAVRGATHFGCAGYHVRRAADRGMIGIIACNCGNQRIARPPDGALAMLGTNPLGVAAPALDGHPFVLDMSTTVVPTGRVRLAASRGTSVPPGWLRDDMGNTVTDPAAFGRGDAHLRWLGDLPSTGAYKGFGLGLAVELLAGLLPGAGTGPAGEALGGDGGPHGRDDDIGFFVLAIAAERLRPGHDFAAAAASMFTALLACPPARNGDAVSYPGWQEAERAIANRRDGVPVPVALYRELVELGLPIAPISPARSR
jgi:LDH2 family malate/lactate/ureidoglycolate dehydrogenase